MSLGGSRQRRQKRQDRLQIGYDVLQGGLGNQGLGRSSGLVPLGNGESKEYKNRRQISVVKELSLPCQ